MDEKYVTKKAYEELIKQNEMLIDRLKKTQAKYMIIRQYDVNKDFLYGDLDSIKTLVKELESSNDSYRDYVKELEAV